MKGRNCPECGKGVFKRRALNKHRIKNHSFEYWKQNVKGGTSYIESHRSRDTQ